MQVVAVFVLFVGSADWRIDKMCLLGSSAARLSVCGFSNASISFSESG